MVPVLQQVLVLRDPVHAERGHRAVVVLLLFLLLLVVGQHVHPHKAGKHSRREVGEGLDNLLVAGGGKVAEVEPVALLRAVLVRHADREPLRSARVQLVVVRLQPEDLDRLAQLDDEPDRLVALGEQVLVAALLDDVSWVVDVRTCSHCKSKTHTN